jgi:hypothetical protein
VRRYPLITLTAVSLALVAGRALAFAPSTHDSISRNACREAGLPTQFCDRVGLEAYGVDGDEWDDLAAHAQSKTGRPLCQSANAVVARLAALGLEYRAAFAALAATSENHWYEWYTQAAKAARAVGRALHTLQDNRAHQGMSNPQHAWFSLGDQCDELASPDDDLVALARARVDTASVLRQVAGEAEKAGVVQLLGHYSCERSDGPDAADPAEQRCTTPATVGPVDACHFLAESKRWDGVDRRWNDSTTETGFLEAFLGGTVWDMCAVSNFAAAARPAVDVLAGPPTCTGISFLCFGKVDDVGASEPDAVEAGGCGVAGPRGQPAIPSLLIVAGVLLALASRRRRARAIS